MTLGFDQLIKHMDGQSADAGADLLPRAPRPKLDMSDPRHIIAATTRLLQEPGKTAGDAYEFILPYVTNTPSALLHIHALGLAAERVELLGNHTMGDVGYHVRALTGLLGNPQEIDRTALAASNSWPSGAARVHASVRRRLMRINMNDAAALVGAHDAEMGIEDYVLNPPQRAVRRGRPNFNGAASRWDND